MFSCCTTRISVSPTGGRLPRRRRRRRRRQQDNARFAGNPGLLSRIKRVLSDPGGGARITVTAVGKLNSAPIHLVARQISRGVHPWVRVRPESQQASRESMVVSPPMAD